MNLIPPKDAGLYLALFSVHGLVRGTDMELGRDADTGGQVKYVVELARALGDQPGVARVDLFTRLIDDPKLDSSYAQREEPISGNARIVRIPCGPRRYVRKERLWPYLDAYIDHCLQYFRHLGMIPDLVHGHYADAGFICSRLAGFLGVPMVFTGHSLGRVKRQRLLESGVAAEKIESKYRISQRIEAEELALDSAALVVASTHQEVDEQYALYDQYAAKSMRVLPPGVDLERFYPAPRGVWRSPVRERFDRFLSQPNKPMILALSRADERKNIGALVKAYGKRPDLQEIANLVIVAGNRERIEKLPSAQRKVFTEILMLIDRYDLHGKVAYPKHHEADEVPDFYRLAARRKGLFVNPALTEPFGLTLIEAAASGLPVVATQDGGPQDIVKACKNGLLIDPLDIEAMGDALVHALGDARQWQRWRRDGIAGARRHYTWDGHAKNYLGQAKRIVQRSTRKQSLVASRNRLPTVKRLIVTDLDDCLSGDEEARDAFFARLHADGSKVGFGIATGRRIENVLRLRKRMNIPMPDILVTSAGTEIHYGHWVVQDMSWQQHIDHWWYPEKIQTALSGFKGMRLQPRVEQRQFKISYYIDPQKSSPPREILRYLRQLDLHVNLVFSHGQYLDLLPVRASKGLALRFLSLKWGMAPEQMLVAGGSGNDEDMLRGNTLAVVVGNHQAELRRLKGRPSIYFAKAENAWGILEGIDHYGFLDQAVQQEKELATS